MLAYRFFVVEGQIPASHVTFLCYTSYLQLRAFGQILFPRFAARYKWLHDCYYYLLLAEDSWRPPYIHGCLNGYQRTMNCTEHCSDGFKN